MFSNNDKKANAETHTIIGGSTKIYGNIHFSGALHIDGEINGNIIADTEGSTLTVSERGKVEGKVQVHRVELNGEVVGDVYAMNDIILSVNARVKGNVYYEKIEMARGSEVNGSLIHGKPAPLEAKPAPRNSVNATNSTAIVAAPTATDVDNVNADATPEEHATESEKVALV